MIIKHPSKEFIETIINGPEPVTKEFKDECIRLSKLNRITIELNEETE